LPCTWRNQFYQPVRSFCSSFYKATKNSWRVWISASNLNSLRCGQQSAFRI
jgi:hypothetical protein